MYYFQFFDRVKLGLFRLQSGGHAAEIVESS